MTDDDDIESWHVVSYAVDILVKAMVCDNSNVCRVEHDKAVELLHGIDQEQDVLVNQSLDAKKMAEQFIDHQIQRLHDAFLSRIQGMILHMDIHRILDAWKTLQIGIYHMNNCVIVISDTRPARTYVYVNLLFDYDTDAVIQEVEFNGNEWHKYAVHNTLTSAIANDVVFRRLRWQIMESHMKRRFKTDTVPYDTMYDDDNYYFDNDMFEGGMHNIIKMRKFTQLCKRPNAKVWCRLPPELYGLIYQHLKRLVAPEETTSTS